MHTFVFFGDFSFVLIDFFSTLSLPLSNIDSCICCLYAKTIILLYKNKIISFMTEI